MSRLGTVGRRWRALRRWQLGGLERFLRNRVCVVVRKEQKKNTKQDAISYYVISLHQLNKRSLNNFLENAQMDRSIEVGCVGLENLRRTVIASTVVCVRIVCQCACARWVGGDQSPFGSQIKPNNKTKKTWGEKRGRSIIVVYDATVKKRTAAFKKRNQNKDF